MLILTELIESELLLLLLRWPYDQSRISSQYNKTTYISQSTTNILTWIKWEGRGMVVGYRGGKCNWIF